MPIYCEIETKNNGAFFAKCGTEDIAGRNSNTSEIAGDDYALIFSCNWYISREYSSSYDDVLFHFNLTTPAFAPAVASALNALNVKDGIEKMTIKITGTHNNLRNTVVSEYITENGILRNVTTSHDHESEGQLVLSLEFEKMQFNNLITNTTGQIKTSGGGY